MADVIKVNRRSEEVKRGEEERRREEEKRKAEQRRQIQVEDMQKRPVWQQREREDDWFTLMGVSPKEGMNTPTNITTGQMSDKLDIYIIIFIFSFMSVHL